LGGSFIGIGGWVRWCHSDGGCHRAIFCRYFTLVFLFLSSHSVNCSHCFLRYLLAFDVSTMLSLYDSNDIMTIPFYYYLYLILLSLSLMRNKDLIDFLRLRVVTTNYSISREKSLLHHYLPPPPLRLPQ